MTAIDWKRFEKGEFLSRLYPSLSTPLFVFVHEIGVAEHHRRLGIRFDMSSPPLDPPSKWEKFNTVQVTLSFFGVTQLSIEDMLPSGDAGARPVTVLRVEFAGDEVDVRLDGQSKLVARAGFGMVGGVSAYQRVDPDPATF